MPKTTQHTQFEIFNISLHLSRSTQIVSLYIIVQSIYPAHWHTWHDEVYCSFSAVIHAPHLQWYIPPSCSVTELSNIWINMMSFIFLPHIQGDPGDTPTWASAESGGIMSSAETWQHKDSSDICSSSLISLWETSGTDSHGLNVLERFSWSNDFKATKNKKLNWKKELKFSFCQPHLGTRPLNWCFVMSIAASALGVWSALIFCFSITSFWSKGAAGRQEQTLVKEEFYFLSVCSQGGVGRGAHAAWGGWGCTEV